MDIIVPYGGNRFCGPYVLAHVLRTDTNTAAAHMRRVSGRKNIFGVSNHLLVRTLEDLGYDAVSVIPENAVIGRFTLAQWARTREELPIVIANVTGHYIIVDGNTYYDNQCHLGKPLEQCKYLRRQLKEAWAVYKRVRE